jgi:hypothetical protein
MPFGTFVETVSDAINPIVVKELRQAVQSRFVIAVLLMFLLVQLLFMGIFLMVQSLSGTLYASDYQAGRWVFMILQGILLATCMLCIPAYSGFRLAAERSDVHIDLFYISALRPRSIIGGKFTAALMLTVIIFSACAPFMTFTYFLRGIDFTSIFFVVSLDFLVVANTTMLGLFVAVVPTGRVLKVLLGAGGLVLGIFAFFYGILGMTYLLDTTLPSLLESSEFWVLTLCTLLGGLGVLLFLYACAVGLLSPPSANRALGLRVTVTCFCILSLPILLWCASLISDSWPIAVWLSFVDTPLALCLVIAVNEREHLGPRIARRIPRRWLLRPLAFLFYSGAAGGVLWACLLGGVCVLTLYLLGRSWPDPLVPLAAAPELQGVLLQTAATIGYAYCYALTAVFLRNTFIRIPPAFTWVLILGLVALGSVLPFLLTFLVFFRDWDFRSVYPWLLPNPVVGEMVVTDGTLPDGGLVVMAALGCWAALVTVLNVRWFVRQMHAFRPHAASTTTGERIPAILSATPMDVTRTAS